MNARLPVVGDDGGSWGTILNNYLLVSHNIDGTLQENALQQAGVVTSINGKTTTTGDVVLTASDVGAQGSATAPAWVPADNGFQAANIDPAAFGSSATPVSGTLYVFRLPVRAATTFHSLSLAVKTAGSGASTGSYVGLYSASGTLLGSSSDIGSSLMNTGEVVCKLSTDQELSPGYTYGAFLINMSTLPVLYLAGNIFGQMLNIGLPATAPNMGALETAGTSLPASITLTELSQPYGVFFMGAK